MSEDGPVPARNLPISARAPGKCILFGEHAVVRGAPELAVAVDLHTQVIVSPSLRLQLNGEAADSAQNPYLGPAVAAAKGVGGPFDVRAVSRLPRAAGLGSSAAFVAALSTALGAAGGGISRPELAQRCFEIERAAQGVGSPGDTTTSVAGGYVSLNAGPSTGPVLWTVGSGPERWEVRRAVDPGWVWVIAYSGIRRSTAEAVRAVSARLERSDGPALLERFASVARAGISAIADGDREEAGRQLVQNQELLREVGVSHPRLEALIEAAAPAALGAKLTGAGCGGSIVALAIPGREMELVRRLARAGAVPFPVRPAAGAVLVELPATALPTAG
jgi:mevalonate kinase